MPGLRHELAHGHQVGTHLCRMEFVSQAVENGHAGIFSQFLYNLLAVTAIFDRIVHAAQHTGSILDGFLFSQVRTGRVKIGHIGALVIGGNLESAACAG